jgi:hypothetical protein
MYRFSAETDLGGAESMRCSAVLILLIAKLKLRRAAMVLCSIAANLLSAETMLCSAAMVWFSAAAVLFSAEMVLCSAAMQLKQDRQVSGTRLTAFRFNARKQSGTACAPVSANLPGGSVTMAA